MTYLVNLRLPSMMIEYFSLLNKPYAIFSEVEHLKNSASLGRL